jgi:hypothetical protein
VTRFFRLFPFATLLAGAACGGSRLGETRDRWWRCARSNLCRVEHAVRPLHRTSQRALVHGSLSGKKFKITQSGLLVGTDPSKCQIVVSEDTLSHEHAWIVSVENAVVVIDRGSTNGTYVNSGESPRISKVGLQNGDRVFLGKKGSVVLTYFSS